MTWSTRELAELAGTTIRTVRHYHDVGLLEQPERGTNGYKHYGVGHLLRVIRIKRLSELGIPLAEIAAMGEADEYPHEALRNLDAELAATIERLQRIRVELALTMRQGSPTDLPPELGAGTAALTDADRAFTLILTRVLGPTGQDALRAVLNTDHRDPGIAEFDHLPADADERVRAELAERMAPYVRGLYREHPGLNQTADSPVGAERAHHTMAVAIRDLYNEAQLDVLIRVHHLLELPGAD
ncbi:MerR family transcriptional regulator [Nocardia sp. NPDC058633]|uniref:MerR family transcriptional regulator n=1 Tax=Nocardia sp. NPDC058633 TaxID=3346568 RepID=UPI00366432A3